MPQWGLQGAKPHAGTWGLGALGPEGGCHPQHEHLGLSHGDSWHSFESNLAGLETWSGRICDDFFWIAVRLSQDLLETPGEALSGGL